MGRGPEVSIHGDAILEFAEVVGCVEHGIHEESGVRIEAHVGDDCTVYSCWPEGEDGHIILGRATYGQMGEEELKPYQQEVDRRNIERRQSV